MLKVAPTSQQDEQPEAEQELKGWHLEFAMTVSGSSRDVGYQTTTQASDAGSAKLAVYDKLTLDFWQRADGLAAGALELLQHLQDLQDPLRQLRRGQPVGRPLVVRILPGGEGMTQNVAHTAAAGCSRPSSCSSTTAPSSFSTP